MLGKAIFFDLFFTQYYLPHTAIKMYKYYRINVIKIRDNHNKSNRIRAFCLKYAQVLEKVSK